jgi:hypothetical protein
MNIMSRAIHVEVVCQNSLINYSDKIKVPHVYSKKAKT